MHHSCPLSQTSCLRFASYLQHPPLYWPSSHRHSTHKLPCKPQQPYSKSFSILLYPNPLQQKLVDYKHNIYLQVFLLFNSCLALAIASFPDGTSFVIVDPAAINAPKPTLTGATKLTLEPTNDFEPIIV